MVSSKLLSQIGAKLRDIVRRCHTMKIRSQGIDRAFGGVNVLLVGDVWRLDPPAGGFLGSIPVAYMLRARQFAATPDVAQGQAILGGRGPDSVQRVTELTECIRTEDAWVLQVQEEFREEQLSEEPLHFLHGRPTCVPGSWLNGSCACGNENCAQLARAYGILTRECRVCQEDRRSRHRVLNKPDERRHIQSSDVCFTTSPAMFSINDIKHEVNKRRADMFAASKGLSLSWCRAKDRLNTQVLHTNPTLQRRRSRGYRDTTNNASICMGFFHSPSECPSL